MKLECPNCKTAFYLKKILYGMPSEEFNFIKYHVGGCVPNSATVHCSRCNWENDEEVEPELH